MRSFQIPESAASKSSPEAPTKTGNRTPGVIPTSGSIEGPTAAKLKSLSLDLEKVPQPAVEASKRNLRESSLTPTEVSTPATRAKR